MRLTAVKRNIPNIKNARAISIFLVFQKRYFQRLWVTAKGVKNAEGNSIVIQTEMCIEKK